VHLNILSSCDSVYAVLTVRKITYLHPPWFVSFLRKAEANKLKATKLQEEITVFDQERGIASAEDPTSPPK
jgi:hypothetical protein